jgi:hypothetical protein
VILASLRIVAILSDSLLSLPAADLSVELYDRTNSSWPDHQAFVANVSSINAINDPSLTYQSSFFQYGHRGYEMRCTSSNSFFNSYYTLTPLIVAIGCACLMFIVLLVVLLSYVYLSMVRQHGQARLLHDANVHKTKSLNLLDEAKTVADRANQTKSDFLAFLCHELR